MLTKMINALVQAPQYAGKRLQLALTGTSTEPRRPMTEWWREQRALATARACDAAAFDADDDEYRKQVRELYKEKYGHYPEGY